MKFSYTYWLTEDMADTQKTSYYSSHQNSAFRSVARMYILYSLV